MPEEPELATTDNTPPGLAGEIPGRTRASLEYGTSASGYVARALPNNASPRTRPHRLMQLQTFSLSDLTYTGGTSDPPLYSLGRPFPSPPTLRRRSPTRTMGDIAAQIHTGSLHNYPIPHNTRAPEQRAEATAVAPTDMHFLALENLPEGQCIIATPDLLRRFLEETCNESYRNRRQDSFSAIDPRQSTQSSHHPIVTNEYQDLKNCSPSKPELCSSTAVEAHELPQREINRDSYNSYHCDLCAREAYNQSRLALPLTQDVAQDLTVKQPAYLTQYLKFKSITREPAAEALASFLVAIFSGGASAQVSLTANRSVSDFPKGNFATQCVGVGIGVMTGVYVAGGISGGHLNPTVTLAFAVFRNFPWRKVIPYWCGQILGGLVGTATIHIIYASGLDVYEGGMGIRTLTGPSSTAGFFLSFPAEYLSNIGSFFQEFLDSCVILLFIMAIGDRKNSPPPDGVNPVVFMFVIIGVAFSLGSQTSYAINPAQDIASRIVASVMGYGNTHWSYRDQYWLWGSWVSNIAGALFGCFLYDFFIYEGNDSPLNRPWPWTWNLRGSLRSLFRKKKQREPKGTGGNGDHLV